MFVGVLTRLAALAFIPVVLADSEDCANDIVQALNASGLDRLANAVASLNGTSSQGQYILTELSQGNNVIFGPTDNACVSLLKACARDLSYNFSSV